VPVTVGLVDEEERIMDPESYGRSGQDFRLPYRLYWAGVVIVATLVMLVVEYLETPTLVPTIPFEDLFVFKLLGYGNLLLIASTVLYVSHLWFTSETVGRWASLLAGLGALASLLALATRWIEVFWLHRPGHMAMSSLYEMVALFGALTVAIYLVMERVYRTRSAGAFVMLIVLATVLFQISLASKESAIPGSHTRILRAYWMYAHVLGSFVGYGAFAVASAMGLAYLVRAQSQGFGALARAFGIRSLPEPDRIERLMHRAVMLGFPVFAMATALGAIWAYEAWGRYWAWDPKETWALFVCLIYASYFFFHYVNHWSGVRMAWWSIAGFAITLFCFIGVRIIWPGVHEAVPMVTQDDSPRDWLAAVMSLMMP
jgi:cytochrome c-type biogenesis protein CcsB